VSWNLLRRTGAAVDCLVALIEQERPDFLLMQEARFFSCSDPARR
jgi:hypothetical protein